MFRVAAKWAAATLALVVAVAPFASALPDFVEPFNGCTPTSFACASYGKDVTGEGSCEDGSARHYDAKQVRSVVASVRVYDSCASGAGPAITYHQHNRGVHAGAGGAGLVGVDGHASAAAGHENGAPRASQTVAAGTFAGPAGLDVSLSQDRTRNGDACSLEAGAAHADCPVVVPFLAPVVYPLWP